VKVIQTNQRGSMQGAHSESSGRLININELSALWSIPRATLYNWVNQRRLPYVKLGRSLRFDLIQLEEFRRQSTMGVAGRR
jgi:excisionase family DNA binding protein